MKDIYNKLRAVPDEAIKPIASGRLKGKSDVNPMWRIKAMTDVFGVCGFGWKYTIKSQWLEKCGDEIKAFCNIDLFVKMDGEWSDAIPGTGGSSFAAIENKGIYVNDEAYKMALTDALSVAMKSLGVAADVYFQKGRDLETKYEMQQSQPQKTSDSQDNKFVRDYETRVSVVIDCLNKIETIDDIKKVCRANPDVVDDERVKAAGKAAQDRILKTTQTPNSNK